MQSTTFFQSNKAKIIWRNIAVVVFAVCFALLGLCVTIIPSRAADEDAFITIGEIYNNPENMQKLYDALRGATSGTTYSQIATLATQKPNAATFRELNNDRDIKVMFGGQVWHVCYLSNDTDGNPILTLYLTDNYVAESHFCNYGFDDGDKGGYPWHMYGTSYVRALLNNGGLYSADGATLVNYPASNDYALASVAALSDAIVTPSKVAWQASGQDARQLPWWSTQTHVSMPYRASNENYEPESNDGFLYSSANLSNRDGYRNWIEDNFWLPSASEVEVIWSLSVPQRTHSQMSWLRSSIEDGISKCVFALYTNSYLWEYNSGTESLAGVCPAIHINLNAAALAANLDEVPDDLGTVVYDGNNHDATVTKPAWYRDAMQIVYRCNSVVVDNVTNVGEYTAEITLGQLTKTVPLTIAPREVTWSGTVTPQNRVYNRERTVGLSTAVTLDNTVAGDDVKVTLSAVVADKNAGDALPLTVTAMLSGADKDNYLLTNPVNTTDYTVNIAQKTIVVKDITADSKVYDNTSRATLTISGAKLDNYILDGDDLTVAVTGTFTQVTVGADIPVTLDIKLVGDDAGNYKIDLDSSQQTTTGNITPRLITVTINDQTVKVGDPLNLTARVTSGSLASGDTADNVYELSITAPDAEDAEIDVNNLPVGEYTITGKGINDNYDITFVNGKYTVLTAEAWDALQTKDDEPKDSNAWLIIIIVMAVAAFIGALVGIGLVVRSHDKNREPKPAKVKKNKKAQDQQPGPNADNK